MVGNGVTDDVIDGNALIPFVHGMGLISNELFEVSVALLIHINCTFYFHYSGKSPKHVLAFLRSCKYYLHYKQKRITHILVVYLLFL